MSNADDPDVRGKQMDKGTDVGFPAEKLSPKSANHMAASSHEV